MIDLNTIISQALAAAVAQALQPIQQEYANKMGEMAQKIAALEYAQAFQADNLHARLRVLEGALTDRVAMLENQALVVSNAVDTRIAASNAVVDRLHERVATREGALTDRVAALEKRVFEDLGTIIEQEFIASMAVTDVVGHDTVQALTDRVAALEKHTSVLDEHGGLLEYLDNQEWFWNKIRNFTDTAVEQAIEGHTDCWDHNDFVTEDQLEDYVKSDSVREEIEDIINGATFSIRT